MVSVFDQVCRVLAAVNARNPLNIVVKSSKRGSSSSSSSSTSATAKLAATNAAAASTGNSSSNSNSNGVTPALAATTTATTKDKDGASTKDKDKDPLKAFRSLLGLSPSEARELYSKGVCEGGGGAGQAALQKELARRKGAYIRLVLTVAPCLGMTHANPGLQHQVGRAEPA